MTPSSLFKNLALEGRLTGRRFRQHWRNYLLQCGLSTLALLLVLLVMDVVLQAAIVVAIAASAFIVFIMPHSKASRPRRVIGGHVVAIIVATALDTVYLAPVLGELAHGSHLAGDVLAVASVGLSILLMVLTRTEHPPAAGTALGLIVEGVEGWDPTAALFVLLGAVMLSAAHFFLRSRLVNLF